MAAACVVWLGSCGIDNADARGLRFGPATMLGGQGDRGRVSLASLAINARKEAIAVLAGNRVVRVTMRSAGGRWGPPVTVSRVTPRNRRPGSVRAALNARGDAVIAWVVSSSVDADAPTDTVVVTRRAARRGWSAPVTWHNAWLAGLGLTARGVAVLAWRRKDRVRITEHHGRRWAPIAEFAPPAFLFSVALDVNADGRAVAMWSTLSGFFASRRSRGGIWSAPETVCMPTGTRRCWMGATQPLEVAVARNGQVIGAALTGSQSAEGAIEVFEYRPSAGWSVPQTLTAGEGPLFGVAFAMNDRGDAVVGWEQWKPTPDTESPTGTVYGHMQALTATRSAAGAWSPPRGLTSPRVSVVGPLEVGITGGGELVAAWTPYQVGTRGKPFGMRVATGSVSTRWRSRWSLGRPGESFALALAVEGSSAIIGWLRSGEGLPWVSVTR